MIDSDADLLQRHIVPEIVPDDWIQEVEECAASPSVTFVTGASLSGTSHFARRLLNRYLTGHGKNAKPLDSVYYLDLDPGNPTYTPHGQVSLVLVRQVNIGPSFVYSSTIPHSNSTDTIVRAHAVPFRWRPDCLDHFVSCAEDLMHTCSRLRQHDHSTPLIINTPDWLYCKSFSSLVCLLSRTTPQRLVHLTDLETIDEAEAAKLDSLEAIARKGRMTFSQISLLQNLGETSHTSADLRSMQMLSYFHCIGRKSTQSSHDTYNSKTISCTAPVEFCYEQTQTSNQAFVGFQLLTEWVDPSQILTALNGSIIQIVETEDESIQQQLGALPRTTKTRIPYFKKMPSGSVEPLDPKTSSLVCTALLRGLDLDRKVVQLIVPKTHKRLIHSLKPDKTVFVFGYCEHPDWAYTEDAYYYPPGQSNEGSIPVNQIESGSQELAPWVAPASMIEDMGYLNVPRRIRRFHGGG